MDILCEKEELIEILNVVQKAVGLKSPNPLIECIKIDCNSDGNAVFTSNNNELCIEYNTNIKVNEGGSIALASKMFGDIVRKLPNGEISINVNEENSITKIKSGISEFNIQGIISNQFPEPPEIEKLTSFTIKEVTLKNIIKKISSFMALTEGKRPTLTGGYFEIRGNEITAVASDGHRLAVVKEEIFNSTSDKSIVIPGTTLREIFKILKEDESEINVIISDRHALFEFKKFRIFTRLIEGDYLKYEPIIAANNTIKIEVETQYLRESLERAMLIINDDDTSPDKKVPVRLSIGYDKIEVSCMTSKGKVNDVINAKIDGGELVIGFNCRFLIDALSVCEDEKIEVDLSTPISGCFMRSLDKQNKYVFMILPVRLYN